jgi:hypothetical protein
MRQQGDANAEFLHVGRALEHPARDAVPMQIERERQAGNAAANDCDVRHVDSIQCWSAPHSGDLGARKGESKHGASAVVLIFRKTSADFSRGPAASPR